MILLNNKKYLTIKEYCELHKVTRMTFYNRLKAGKIDPLPVFVNGFNKFLIPYEIL